MSIISKDYKGWHYRVTEDRIKHFQTSYGVDYQKLIEEQIDQVYPQEVSSDLSTTWWVVPEGIRLVSFKRKNINLYDVISVQLVLDSEIKTATLETKLLLEFSRCHNRSIIEPEAVSVDPDCGCSI